MAVEQLNFERTGTRSIEWEATTTKGEKYIVIRILPSAKFTAYFIYNQGNVKKVGEFSTPEFAFEACQEHLRT